MSSGGGSHSDAVETATSRFCAAPGGPRGGVMDRVSVASLNELIMSRAASHARPGDLIRLGRSVGSGCRVPGRWSTEGRSGSGHG